MPESFDKDAGLRPATLLKKRLWHRCFPVNFVKFLRTPFFIEHLWWLLLQGATSVKIIREWETRRIVLVYSNNKLCLIQHVMHLILVLVVSVIWMRKINYKINNSISYTCVSILFPLKKRFTTSMV